jgi:hypothetical protein
MTPLDRDRLAKILAMLASPHRGEVLAAVQAALKFLNAAGVTWHELLATKELEGRDEILRAKIDALRASNERLRLENRALRSRAVAIRQSSEHDNRQALHAFAAWVAFICCVGMFLFLYLH